VAVLVMAIVQVAVAVMASRTAERVGRLADQIERDIRPVITNLQSVSAEAARATSMAAAQVERADRTLTDMASRLEQTLNTVQESLLSATRSGAWAAGLKAAMAIVDRVRSRSRRRSASVDEEDALFIG